MVGVAREKRGRGCMYLCIACKCLSPIQIWAEDEVDYNMPKHSPSSLKRPVPLVNTTTSSSNKAEKVNSSLTNHQVA